MPKATWTTWAGIAKETTAGTAVTASSFFTPTAITGDDKLTYLEDKGWRNAPVDVWAMIPGAGHSEFSMSGNVRADVIGFPVAGVLGLDAVTGSAAPYTHAMTTNNSNQPPTYTLTVADIVSARQYAGSIFSEVGFKATADGLFTYDAKGLGQLSAVQATPPAQSWSSIAASPAWAIQAKIGGTTVSSLQEFEYTITRPVTPLTAIGKQSPYALWGGNVGVAGKLSFWMEDESQLTQYLNGTPTSLDLNLTSGTGSTATQVNLHSSQVVYKSATRDRGKEALMLQVDFTALANTTDASTGYSPCKVTLQNANPTGTYV